MHLYRRTLSADCSTPVSVFSSLKRSGECFLFESAEGGEHWGRYSIIGAEPAVVATELEQQGQSELRLHYRDGRKETVTSTIQVWLRDQVIAQPCVDEADDLPFSGGAVGYFSYDMVHQFEAGVSPVESQSPISACMLIDRFVVFDNLRGVMHLCVLADAGQQAAADQQLKQIQQNIENASSPATMNFGLNEQELLAAQMTHIQPNMSQRAYEEMVDQAKEYILAGDIFQVVLSQRFSSPLDCDLLSIYRAVRHINPSPYLFYLHVDDTVLIGSSPEILVKKEGDRAIVRPIAGTRPRGANEQQDKALEQELLVDEKELAEHVMLVDLGRNDLGRVCEFGSVHVSDSMCIERYSHVMHIVSQVEGTLRDDVDALDLLAATFPAGTLSGAPKVRAMQIIQEQEKQARGPYGGCIGYISFGGRDMDTAIVIRTAVIRNNEISVQAGAGIVADSVPEKEYQECVNKASAMFRAVAIAKANQTEDA